MSDEQIPGWAVELIRQVERLNEKIPSHVEWATRNILDLEKRMRVLEAFKWKISGIASLVALVASIVVEVIARSIAK
jgi:hypothetical protein